MVQELTFTSRHFVISSDALADGLCYEHRIMWLPQASWYVWVGCCLVVFVTAQNILIALPVWGVMWIVFWKLAQKDDSLSRRLLLRVIRFFRVSGFGWRGKVYS